MVGFLTFGSRKFEELDPKMRTLLPPLYKAMKEMLPYVDHDAAAFSDFMVSLITNLFQQQIIFLKYVFRLK